MNDADRWNSRYTGDDFFYGNEPNDFLREQAANLPVGGRILCLADGEGRNGVWLAAQGFHVTSVDMASVGLEKAARFAETQGVTIQTEVADLADYDLGESSWDGIVSIWCHLPQPLRADLHQRCLAALRPGGVFLLEAYTPDQLRFGTGGPPVAELMMTRDALQHELPGLQIEILHEKERHITEGKGHHGQSAVVQLLGTKP